MNHKLEEKIAQKLFSEHIKSGSVKDIPSIISLISSIYNKGEQYDTPITKRHAIFVREFVFMIKKSAKEFDIDLFIKHAKELYEKYNSIVEINLSTDSLYDTATKAEIGEMCKKICGVKDYEINEHVSTSHGGGFIARFRDYRYDASYGKGLSS